MANIIKVYSLQAIHDEVTILKRTPIIKITNRFPFKISIFDTIEKIKHDETNMGIVGGSRFINFNTLLATCKILKIPTGSVKRAKRKIDPQLKSLYTSAKAIVKNYSFGSIYLVGETIKKEDIFRFEDIYPF